MLKLVFSGIPVEVGEKMPAEFDAVSLRAMEVGCVCLTKVVGVGDVVVGVVLLIVAGTFSTLFKKSLSSVNEFSEVDVDEAIRVVRGAA